MNFKKIITITLLVSMMCTSLNVTSAKANTISKFTENVTVTETKNNITKTYISSFNSLKDSLNNNLNIIDSNTSNSISTITPYKALAPDDGLTPWIYCGYREFSTRIYTHTWTAVSAIVAYIAGCTLGALGAGATALISSIIADKIPQIYTCQNRWLKYEVYPNSRRFIAAEKTYNKEYYDSHHRNFIRSFYSEQYGG